MSQQKPPTGKLERFEEGKSFRDQLTASRLNSILAEIEARTPRRGVNTLLVADNAGFSYSGTPGGRAGGSAPLGFRLYVTDDGGTQKIGITPSVVTGLSTIIVPTLSGDPLDDESPPYLSITGTKTIYLKMTIEVSGVEIPGLDPAVYEINAGNPGPKDNSITVEAYSDEESTGEILGTIDSETGAKTQDGIYLIPLGKATKTGSDITIDQQYMYGPIGVKLCSAGAIGLLTVIPPTIIHTGEIDEIA